MISNGDSLSLRAPINGVAYIGRCKIDILIPLSEGKKATQVTNAVAKQRLQLYCRLIVIRLNRATNRELGT
jgi:hypothetical protein